MAEGHIGYRDGPRGRSYFYVIPITRPDGSRGQEQRRGFPHERAARAAMRKRLVELESGTAPATSNQTLAEYLAAWLEQCRRDLSPASLAKYERTLRSAVLPVLGEQRLDRLTPFVIDAAYTRALERGCSANQVRSAHRLLKRALERAVDWNLLPRNPGAGARPPRKERTAEGEDRRVRALTDTEASRLLGALEGPAWLAAVLSLGTGLRRGELLGLRWRDIDFEAGTISVRQTVEPAAVKGGSLIVGPPKTEHSARTFRAPERIVALLWEQRRRQEARRVVHGGPWEGDLVLCRDGGCPILPDTLNDWHAKARARAGLPREIRFHDLRHTYATNSLRAGVSVTTVSRRLGHSSVSVTLNVYSHALPEDHAHAARVADAALDRVFGLTLEESNRAMVSRELARVLARV
jgi:integrase